MSARYYAVACAARRQQGEEVELGISAAVVRLDPGGDIAVNALEAAVLAFPADDGWTDHFAHPFAIADALIDLERARAHEGAE